MSKLDKIVRQLLKISYCNQEKLASFKREWAKKNGFMPKNTEILTSYKQLIKQKKIKANEKFENLLRLKKIRSLSGIVPIAVLTKPYPCPGKCVYCPTQKKMPKSYLDDEPAAMRAKAAHFDPYVQVKRRLSQLKLTGHTTDKVELIVMGGTFSSLPRGYQIEFITQCFAGCNGKKIQMSKFKFQNLISKLKILKEQQKINETAKHRIVGLTLETRPDKINKEEIKFMRRLGCTRVEIGVQAIDNKILDLVKRGHHVQATVKATKLLKDAGLKVCYHLMPNLPGSTLKNDLQMFKTIFTNSLFMPDMIKLYPCVVCYQAELYNWYKKNLYHPYSDKDLIDLLISIKKIVPQWVRINRLARDIPIANIAAGNKMSNLRQILTKKLKARKISCQCIRCRETKDKSTIKKMRLKIIKYKASRGLEFFLQFVGKNNVLYSLLRLRIIAKTAIVRELHTYGEALAIGLNKKKASQHQGLGKKLLLKAEKLAKDNHCQKIKVVSGIGVREYYRKLGYLLKGTDMEKLL